MMRRLTFLLALVIGTGAGEFVATPDYDWSFPRDHGAHPKYQTEWWYFSGIVSSEERQFGYQFTIFRRRTDAAAKEGSEWFTNQLFLGHLAIADLGRRTHHSFSRQARGHPRLAHADESMPGTIRLRDWRLSFDGDWTIQAAHGDYRLSLKLSPTRPVLFQGPNGYSRKGPKPGQASHYYSQARLKTEGELTANGERFEVTGATWFDHEFGSSQLSEEQVGWDWVSLRLSDGSDLMLYRLREKGGDITPQSSATIRREGEEPEYIPKNEWTMKPIRYWRSQKTGAKYPVRWRLKIPEHNIDLTLSARFNAQEMLLEGGLTDPYWEGAIRADGTIGTNPVTGDGYLEMTGYASSMSGAF